jgi:hypothetical protein
MAADRLADQLGDDRLEVWDQRAETWVPREDLFDGGTGDAGRLLSPTGELHVRNAGNQIFSYARSSVADPAASGQDAS